MSQNISNKSNTAENLTNSVPIKSWSVETDAEDLMNDLFLDIDHILESGSHLPNESAQTEYNRRKPLVTPSLTIPSVINQSGQLLQPPEINDSGAQNQHQFNPEQNQNTPNSGSGKYFDKIMFIFAFFSLIGVVGWLISQEKLKLPLIPAATPVNQPVTIQNQISAADSQFIAYMLRSLEVIDRKTPTDSDKKNQNSPDNRQLSNQSSSVSLNAVPLAPNQTPTVIERVYIPVYPTGENAPAATVTPSSAPKVVPTSSPISQTTPASVTPKITPKVEISPKIQPTSATIPQIKIPAEEIGSSSLSPSGTNVLVGLLESGDRSAALFDINNTTQRVKVGEAIGSSGWTLVSVANQKALIRRNGEVRFIYVGQKV